MKNYASFAEINVTFITIPKAQLLNTVCISYLLKNLTLIKALFFLRRDKVNLLVYDRPYFKQKQKNITKF